MTRLIVYAAAAIYPILVFLFLVILKIPIKFISIFVVCGALIIFLTHTAGTTRKHPRGKKDRFRIISAGLMFTAGLAGLLFNSSLFLKLYPVLMNVVMLASFGYTLLSPPSMIFRFAVLQDKKIRGSLAEKRIENYCRKVTVVWCAFFIINGGIAAWTVFSGSDLIWSVYNGGLSYILIGSLFVSELIIRKMTDKKMPKAIPLSQFLHSSRPLDHVLCYEKAWGDGIYKTWKNFLEDTARLRAVIQNNPCKRWILHADDCWYFLCAFTALLQCGREICLTANITPGYIAEIRAGHNGNEGGETSQGVSQEAFPAVFLTDQSETCTASNNSLFIPSLLEAVPLENAPEIKTINVPLPAINADNTNILMYTSGSTGKPKVVSQRLTEFENDNLFILSKWGEEWLSRKVCSTVSQHHIYGLLYGILLPFTAGVPFRRRRIETPEEFENLVNEPYMIITVPAFLKRAAEFKAVESKNSSREPSMGLTSPWIYTSGGALEKELAAKTEKLFGFWPLEVYGSTETSGIAWRFSSNGPEWTPFDNAAINLNDEGCLVIRSPYIKNPEGFLTSDLAQIFPDGRFILNGRADSVVKIEEKRISLTEIEERLRQCDLVADVCVIAIKDKRQYVAAAVVLSEKGNETFKDCEKHMVNRHLREYLLQFLEPVAVPRKWRYVQSIVSDAQGKKKKAEIEALFYPDTIKSRLLGDEKLIEQGVSENGNKKTIVEFTIPAGSDYFNEHFPEMRILPAVAQFELAVRFANRYLETSLFISSAKKLKFSSPIRPAVPLRMELLKLEKSVNFTITSPDGDTVYSTGNFVTEAAK